MQQWTTRTELDHQVVTLHRQGLPRRAIARALSVSRNTVRKILAAHGRARQQPQSGIAQRPAHAPRPQKVDAFVPKVDELLVRYPAITARRVFEELRDAGFDGGYTAIKVYVRKVRPRRKPEPSLTTPVYGPGKMAESDWSPYTIDFEVTGRATVQVLDYVLVWSTRKDYRIHERCDLYALMDGLRDSFERFEGVAEECKFDNQKAVVLCWEGQQPIYNPRLLVFAAHYEWRPHACRPRRPNDKPRAERSFWEFEQSFLCGRSFRDIEDMRAQLAVWQERTCDTRVCRKRKRSRLELFAEERPHLVPLPAHPYDTARVVYRVCSIDGFVSYEGNRYAVPYDHITDILPVRITQKELFVYAADLALVARHELASRGAGHDIDPLGIHPPCNRRGADLDQLEQTFAGIGEDAARFFAGLRDAQGRSAGFHARQILMLRERYATADLGAALAHAMRYGAFEQRAVERILAARAAPRRLAEYVAEETARRLDEPPGQDTHLRDLGEYDRLPGAPQPEESKCPDETTPKTSTSSPHGSDDTSTSSG